MQRQFVSDVSHELRTPLTTIRMAADLLFEARDQLESAASRSAELLQSQLGRFESLLGDLLEISRYDANAATLEAELVDVCDVVRQSADVAQQLAERRGARIEFRLPGRALPGRDGPQAGRADPAEPAVQRGRARRGPGRGRDLGRRPGRGGGGGARLRRGAGAGRGAPGLRPVLAGRPGAGADHGRHRARPRDRAGGRQAARRLARGVGRARQGLGLPADAAARGWSRTGRAHRCRWCPTRPISAAWCPIRPRS